MRGSVRTTAIVFVLMGVFLACEKSDKSSSPECLKAQRDAREHRAEMENINRQIEAAIRTDELKLDNLQKEDEIARLQGKPIKNRLAEALLRSKIQSIRLDNQPYDSGLEQLIVDAACK
jgi:hypothetical protein